LSSDTKTDNSLHFFQFVAPISVPNNFPEFNLFSLGHPSSTEKNDLFALIRAKICEKKCQLKTVANPADNEEGMKPFGHFLCKRTVFFGQTNENP